MVTIVVEYKGKSIETLTWVEVTDEERLELKQAFYAKPDFTQVLKQLQTISKDGVMVDKITRYYFRDIMAKVHLKNAKWTVEDVFESNELLGIFKAKTLTNTRVFDSNNLSTNIDTAIRLGGHNVASLPPNFPMKIARNIVKKYNTNNNWYDFSCGWGVRLLCALSAQVNYFGTDPNYMLTERLEQLTTDYQTNIETASTVDIRTQGSEIFIPEWENRMGLAFSSPPYFDLEDYVIGKQSYTPEVSYQQWKENYLIPTLKNIYLYLTNNGILALNIKNGKTYKLADDTKQLAESCGFQLIDIELLTNNQRVTSSGPINNAENIFIFKKKEKKNILPAVEIKVEESSTTEDPINASLPEPEQTTIKPTIIPNKLDIYLIGVKSKKQLDDKDIYNSENKFLGERYFATFSNTILNSLHYNLNKYIEMTKQNIIELLNYVTYHRDCNNSFKTVVKLCEIIDTWEEMEDNNFHLFLQIEEN